MRMISLFYSVPHQRLDLVNFLGRRSGQYFIAFGGDQHVVLDAYADALPAFVQFGFEMDSEPRPVSIQDFAAGGDVQTGSMVVTIPGSNSRQSSPVL